MAVEEARDEATFVPSFFLRGFTVKHGPVDGHCYEVHHNRQTINQMMICKCFCFKR